jgi:DNA-nicking Smr family endonuclease
MSPCDKHLFQQAVKDVTPLRPSKKHTSRPPHTARIHKPKPHQQHTDEACATHTTHTLSHPWELSTIHAETNLSYGKNQLQRKQWDHLKQGKIRCEAQLDLHGLRIEPAADALVQFIRHAHRQNQRCVRVIHGKGGRYGEAPVLKTHVNHWLKQLPEVLAFHSACARDGGSGALYVLLKKS